MAEKNCTRGLFPIPFLLLFKGRNLILAVDEDLFEKGAFLALKVQGV